MVDGPPSSINVEKDLYQCFNSSSFSESEKWRKISWLRENIKDRDSFMAELIAIFLFDGNVRKGIYYAGAHHVRKDLRIKYSGRRLFSTGGVLSRKYPGRVCSLALHKKPEWWQSEGHFNYLEQFFKDHGKPFAIDSSDSRIAHLKIKSDVSEKGITLPEVFDGYIMLNLDKNYTHCDFIPGFYDDEFVEEVWHQLREEGQLKRFPAELQKWKQTPWTGEEFMELMKQGLH